jgi:integrase
MRKAEIASLRWEDCDGESIRLQSENALSGTARLVPFEGELADLIARRKAVRQFKEKRNGDPVRLDLPSPLGTDLRLSQVMGYSLPEGGNPSPVSRFYGVVLSGK